MLDVRRAAAKLLLVALVVVWRAVPPWLLKLMTGFGQAAPRGSRPYPGGGTRPRANRLPRVDDGRDPAEVRCMNPLEGIYLEGHAVVDPPAESIIMSKKSCAESPMCLLVSWHSAKKASP